MRRKEDPSTLGLESSHGESQPEDILTQYAKWKISQRPERIYQESVIHKLKEHYNQGQPFVILPGYPNPSEGNPVIQCEKQFRERHALSPIPIFFINNYGNCHWDCTFSSSGLTTTLLRASGERNSCGVYTVLNIILHQNPRSQESYFSESSIVNTLYSTMRSTCQLDNTANTIDAELARSLLSSVVEDRVLGRLTTLGCMLEDSDFLTVFNNLGILCHHATDFETDQLDLEAWKNTIAENFSGTSGAKNCEEEDRAFNIFCAERNYDFQQVRQEIMRNNFDRIAILPEAIPGVSEPASSGDISSMEITAYMLWFNRVKYVLKAYKRELIAESQAIYFQQFLLDMGQFNASFTSKELERLGYPKSPFAITEQHSYLRSVETWAMKILRSQYQQQPGNADLYPIWLDSSLFWKELERYCEVIDGKKDIEAELATRLHNKQIIWIRLQKPAEKGSAQNAVNCALCDMLCEKQSIPEPMRNILKKAKRISQADFAVLDEFFKQQLEQMRKKEVAKVKQELTTPLSNQSQWFNRIFKWARKKDLLPEGIVCPEQLTQFAVNENGLFEQWLAKLRDSMVITDIQIDVGCYLRCVDEWRKDNLTPWQGKFIYFICAQFQGMEALVFVKHNEAQQEFWFPKSIVNQLGYRISPFRAINKILELYPGLFFDSSTTENFWNTFISVTEVQSLTSIQELTIEESKTDAIEFTQLNLSDWQNNLKQQIPHLAKSFCLYGQFIQGFLDYYCTNQFPNSVHMVADEEIAQALKAFLFAAQRDDLATAVRCAQSISEIFLLCLNWNPLEKLLPEIVRQQLSGYPVQQVCMMPYAMRAFALVFQLLGKEDTLNIVATNQSYFEWLHRLAELGKKPQIMKETVRHLNDITPSADIIFVEIHPNNAVENSQFAHDVRQLICTMSGSEWANKQRTLVVDVTLNALNEREVLDLLQEAQSLLQTGRLNLMLLQSLTKFAQIGLDKCSAGLLVVLNSGLNWQSLNQAIKVFTRQEPANVLTMNFFSYFMTQTTLIKEYLALINQNVRFVYEQATQQFSRLETVPNQGLFQLTMSTDPRACYVAWSLKGAFSDSFHEFYFEPHTLEGFSQDVLDFLIIPICEALKLPLTQRWSIGFPLSSASAVLDTVRLTIGLESREQLQHYVDVIIYAAFVLNRQQNKTLFFVRNSDNQYDLRRRYLTEKAEQFKAMTPGLNCRYEINFESSDPTYGSCTDPSTGYRRPLRRHVLLDNGRVTWWQEGFNSRTLLSFEQAQRICVHIQGSKGPVDLYDERVSWPDRRMAIACLTECFVDQQQKYQNVNLLWDTYRKIVSFESFEILGLWSDACHYGPFSVIGNQGKIYFSLEHRQITVKINDEIIPEDNLVVKKGGINIPFVRLPVDEREFLLREGAYSNKPFVAAFYGFTRPNYIQPIPQDKIRLTYQDHQLIIERDFVCFQGQGVTVYKRFLGGDETCLEIDFWGEKDPELARFFRLLVAIEMKETHRKSCLARDRRFFHFIIRSSYENVDQLVQEAVIKISDYQAQLKVLLKNYQGKETCSQQYRFQCDGDYPDLSWPSRLSGIGYINGKEIILEAMSTLVSQQSTPPANSTASLSKRRRVGEYTGTLFTTASHSQSGEQLEVETDTRLNRIINRMADLTLAPSR